MTATTSTAPAIAQKRSTSRAKRRKANHKPLKLMLTAGTFLATWLGTGWLAQQEAANAVAIAQTNQPAPVTITYVEPDGTLSERTLDLGLQPIPQVVVNSRSSR